MPDSRYPDAGGNRHSWRRLRAPGEQQAGAAGQPAFGPQGFIDLSDLFAHTGAATALAATAIYSDRNRAVALRFGADSAVALLVDGKPLYTSEDGKGFAFDQHAVAVELHPGWNGLCSSWLRSWDGTAPGASRCGSANRRGRRLSSRLGHANRDSVPECGRQSRSAQRPVAGLRQDGASRCRGEQPIRLKPARLWA